MSKSTVEKNINWLGEIDADKQTVHLPCVGFFDEKEIPFIREALGDEFLIEKEVKSGQSFKNELGEEQEVPQGKSLLQIASKEKSSNDLSKLWNKTEAFKQLKVAQKRALAAGLDI